jgi:hypothetical protein
MSIRCFFGRHDYESFGDGIPILAIISRSAHIKADALYMKEFEQEIFEAIRTKIKRTFFGDSDMQEFVIKNHKIRDEICLRCGKIKPNIQISRAITDSYAVFVGMTIKLREDRQKKAKAMLDYKKEMDCI